MNFDLTSLFNQSLALGAVAGVVLFFYPRFEARDKLEKIEEKEHSQEMKAIIKDQTIALTNNTNAFNNNTAVLSRVITVLDKHNLN